MERGKGREGKGERGRERGGGREGEGERGRKENISTSCILTCALIMPGCGGRMGCSTDMAV